MADPFQPKFVDLVRNYTSTSGTGNLALDEAPPGFKSFTEALLPGDSFYYSIAGIENTSESEVGRGTLQADGSIARQPIGGALTSFSSGKKTVALVAAAEWYESLDAVRGAPMQAVTRAALATLPAQGTALLTEAGREGLFRFDPANLSAKVAADSAQGLFVAPASDPTGASGAWARQFDGAVDPRWFGIVEGNANGANAAANNAAWAAMMATLNVLAVNTTAIFNRSLRDVRFGMGTFEFSAPLELASGAIDISGRGQGHGLSTVSSAATKLKFYGSTGIRIQSNNTSGTSNKDAALHISGAFSAIRDLSIEGNFSGAEAEHHGVHARATFTAQNVTVRNFAGDGWRIEADSTTIGGNACGYTMINCSGWACRNGLYEDGDNTSASTIIGGIWNLNRQWGLWQSNFLGNAHVGMEFATNGITSYNNGTTIGASVVSHNGNLYAAIAGQEAGASTNAPSGTSAHNTWWMFHDTGGPSTGRPAWTSGMLVRAGGCVRDDDINSKNTYEGCYAEQDQGRAQICQRSLVKGGMLAVWCFQGTGSTQGTAIIDGGNDGLITVQPALEATSGNVTARLGATNGNVANQILSGKHASASPNGHSVNLDTALNGLLLTYSNSTSSATYQLLATGPNTTDSFGTSAPVPHAVYIPRLMVGDNSNNRSNARRILVDTAAPTSGAHGQGEFVHYRGSSPNLIGWKCTAAGSPGSWESLYGLMQMQAAGSGLTVGATDKILGRSSAGSGPVEELSCTSAGRALLAGADSAAQRASLGLKRGLGFHCAGVPAAGEVIGGGIAPYALTLSAQNCACKALTAATAAITLTIRKNGTDIGSIAFAAGGTTGTVSLTTTSVAAGEQITIHNPASADSTLADIDGLISE